MLGNGQAARSIYFKITKSNILFVNFLVFDLIESEIETNFLLKKAPPQWTWYIFGNLFEKLYDGENLISIKLILNDQLSNSPQMLELHERSVEELIYYPIKLNFESEHSKEFVFDFKYLGKLDNYFELLFRIDYLGIYNSLTTVAEESNEESKVSENTDIGQTKTKLKSSSKKNNSQLSPDINFV